MSTDNTELDEQDDVPTLKKYQVNLTLTDLFTTLVERPRFVVEAARSATAQQGVLPSLQPEVIQHLQRISELASELREEINQINQIDPDVLNRLKQG
jgi:hypothetical protein